MADSVIRMIGAFGKFPLNLVDFGESIPAGLRPAWRASGPPAPPRNAGARGPVPRSGQIVEALEELRVENEELPVL